MVEKKIQMYGAEWCSYCRALKQKLDQREVDYDYIDVDQPENRTEMNNRTDGNETIPVLFVDESYKVNPSDAELDELLQDVKTKGVTMANKEEKQNVRQCIMIGAGPANLAAAVYTTREDIDTLLLEKGVVGGLAAITDVIDNYPGFEEGIEGIKLAEKLEKQAERFGAEIDFAEVVGLNKESDGLIKVQTSSGDMLAKTVLIGTGSDHRMLGLESEKKYYGRGVHYCATCDGAFYRDKKLVVVGGGNSSAQEALFLTRFASHIDILIRKDQWKASDVLVEEIENHPKITVHFNTSIDEIVGKEVDGMDKVVKVDVTKDGEKTEIETDGVFIFIGLIPNTQFLEKSDVKLDEFGFVLVDDHMRTSVEGVFCAGDVRSGATAQIASAVGEGAVAALRIREYIEGKSAKLY